MPLPFRTFSVRRGDMMKHHLRKAQMASAALVIIVSVPAASHLACRLRLAGICEFSVLMRHDIITYAPATHRKLHVPKH